MGEHTLGLLLTLFRKIKQGDGQIREGLWLREENRGAEIGGKTIGLIGYGHMGKAFAKRLAGFDCEVLAFDKAPVENPFSHVKLVSLHEIQKKPTCSACIFLTPRKTITLQMLNFWQHFKSHSGY